MGVSRLVATLLANRGLTPSDAAAFRRREPAGITDPFALPEMDRAVARILRALQDGETICVYGDYDADGLTATALLVTILREMAGRGGRGSEERICWHIPSRVGEGYGVNKPALKAIREGGASLVVTVDCGVTAVEEIEFARSIGLDCVVTDHHEPGPRLPKAQAVVNPRRADSGYPFRELAGVGVAYKLAQALAVAQAELTERGRGGGRPGPAGGQGNSSTPAAPHQLSLFDSSLTHGEYAAGSGVAAPARWDALLDLVALGTVADVVPLLDENRHLVYRGLGLFNPPLRPGLRALRRVAGLEGKEITAYHLGFGFGPRLNAGGRVGDAERGLRLLLTLDAAEAASLSQELDRSNRERQALEERILQDAVARVEEAVDLAADRAIVVAREGWPEGVIGIVAARLVERYARPALLVAVNGGSGRGSGRSIEAFDLAGALEACAHLLGRHGGHRLAAGFEISAEAIAGFTRDFLALARDRLSQEDLVHELRIDACVEPGDLLAPGPAGAGSHGRRWDRAGGGEARGAPAWDLFRELELLEPHGAGNPEPLLALRGVGFGSVRTVGEGGRHLKAVIVAGGLSLDAIGFGLGPLAAELAAGRGSAYDVAFRPGIDEWNGSPRVELKLVDVRPTGVGAG